MSDVVTQLRIPRETADRVSGIVVAVVDGECDNGQPLVRWATGGREAQPAQAVWMKNSPRWSTCKGLRVVLGFEEGNESKPILLGLIDSPPCKEESAAESSKESDPAIDTKPKILHIESEQELILKCGKAKVALRADGRVEILGGYVLSRSKGVNKIKGGSVQIN